MNAQGKIAAAPGKVLVFPARPQPNIRVLVPREHGTWGLLLFPLISGAIVGHYASPNASLKAALWFFLTALSAFLIYQPLESLLGFSLIKARSERQQRVATISVIVLAVMATAGVLELFNLHRGAVLGIGLVALGCFGVRISLGSSRAMRVPRQLIGALGLSSAAAGAYYAATGQIGWTGILLWLASWFFAVGQIEYVHLRISTAQVAATPAETTQQHYRMLAAPADDCHMRYRCMHRTGTAPVGACFHSLDHSARRVVDETLEASGRPHPWRK